jgi:hypothetical protein
MARGMQVILGLGFAGVLVVLGSGLLGDPRSGMERGRVFSPPGKPTPVAPNPTPGDEGGRQAAPAIVTPPGFERKTPGEDLATTVRKETAQSTRLPARIANLVKRQNLERVIEKYARQHGVDQDLVWAIIRQESGFNPRAVSPKGAMGLMQLMPGTAAMLGVSDAFDLEQNLAGGIKYLERCLNQFNQDVSLALAAYNAGPDNVVKYQGCPPFPETRQYVARVLKAYAGEPMRGDLILIGASPGLDEATPEPASPGGLAWKVPRPQWRIAAPQVKCDSPRWRVTLRPF